MQKDVRNTTKQEAARNIKPAFSTRVSVRIKGLKKEMSIKYPKILFCPDVACYSEVMGKRKKNGFS